MLRIDITNGLYAEALPNRQYACLVVDADPHLMTHLGRVDLINRLQPLYLRVTHVEGQTFKLAGQSNNSPETLEWIDGIGWTRYLVVACGVSPVIYDNAGDLHISDCSIGSQGWRFCAADGRLWTGDETVAPKPNSYVPEWTDLGDGLTIGQCNLTAGIAVWDGTATRLVDAGDAYFIRARRSGEDVAIAAVRPSGQPTTLLWTTMAELRACPVIPVTPPVPPIAAFAWPVYIAPFSDPDHRSGCPVNVDDLGILCETADELPTVIRQAEAEHKRVCFIWDHPTAPVVPSGLRAWDQVWIEAYRLKTETLEQSVQRWWANLLTLEASWPGDSGIIPMFYCQGATPPNELWTVPEVLEANARVPALLNTLPRVKVVAPFAYDRLNGITAHPPLQTRLNQYQAASPGVPVLVPIPPIPPPDGADSRLLYSLIERRTSHMTATRVVGGPMLKASGGGYGVILNNPIDQDYLGLPPKNTVLQGGPASGQVVLTVTPSGDFQCRDKNAIGSWETGTPSGGFLVYTGDGGQRFLIPFAK